MRRALASLAGGLILLAGLGYWALDQLGRPGSQTAPVTLVLPRGTGLGAMAERLAAAGAVRGAWMFMAAALLQDKAAALKPGEYRVPVGASPRDVVALIAGGHTVVRRLTVAEGLTVKQVMAVVAGAEGLEDRVAEAPAEGSLAPETYNYSWGDSRADLLARMRRAQARLLADLWPKRSPDLPLASAQEALVLASIVERETAIPDERPRVAAVFINRLKKGMKLQSDPTVIYDISGGMGVLERPLSRADLAQPGPHNTYVIDGLPPAPIANPGRAAVQAVLQPAKTDELYFVADGTGGHVFAKTLEEHNRNVRRLRTLEKGQ